MDQALHNTPIGQLRLTASHAGLRRIELPNQLPSDAFTEPAANNPHLAAAIAQLDCYFAGELSSFDLSLDPIGTDFQRLVWNALSRIPAGSTETYGGIARAIGRPAAARAVGMANNRNPLPIVVPCHRVVGSDGKLVGYAGELWRKDWLLRHERSPAPALA